MEKPMDMTLMEALEAAHKNGGAMRIIGKEGDKAAFFILAVTDPPDRLIEAINKAILEDFDPAEEVEAQA